LYFQALGSECFKRSSASTSSAKYNYVTTGYRVFLF
jgi:hypothetical protein